MPSGTVELGARRHFSLREFEVQDARGFDHVELEDTLEANALSREFCNLFYEPELANARRRLTRRGMDVDVFIASTPERSWECSEECPGCRSWNYETL
jgi:hypothetical protein